MNTNEFLTDLHSRGVILRAAGDRLKIDAPAGLLSNEALAELRARKAELLAALTSGHFCPRCGSDTLKLQDKTHDAWYCAACRKWATGQGGAIAEIETVRPITLEKTSGHETEATPKWGNVGPYIESRGLKLPAAAVKRCPHIGLWRAEDGPLPSTKRWLCPSCRLPLETVIIVAEIATRNDEQSNPGLAERQAEPTSKEARR